MTGTTFTILVVEDSPTQAEYLRHHLERLGHRITVARDGSEALDEIAAVRPDCVVSDVVMPRMDGYELCRRLKDDETTRSLPVVLVTVLDDPREVVRCLCCGADAFVRKPIDPARLDATIGDLLSRTPRATDASSGPMDIAFRGEAFTVDADRRHILDLLLTTYETAVEQNAELRELTGKLAARSTELLREVDERRRAEEQTRAALRREEEVNAELDAFAHSVSHDLKAPLRAVGGLCSILAEEHGAAMTAEARELMASITTACDRASLLVTDLLELSRVTRIELRRRSVDLSALGAAVVTELRTGDPDRSCHIDVQPGMVTFGDEALIRVVLANLVGNAWKFTSKRPGAHIGVGVEVSPEGPVFFVRDDGVGFEAARASELFAPFRRLHRQADYSGTGVGLAIVQRAVRRHGGRVWAESSPGQGAVFRFTLPPPDSSGPPERDGATP